MSQYSEIVGSFIRTGNYPLEADYIFGSELELKDFYADPINNTLLHKGLLKIVSTEDLQTLYWVDNNLLFKPLIQTNSIEELLNKIEALKGTSDDADFREGLDNLLSVSNYAIETNTRVSNIETRLDNLVTSGGGEPNTINSIKRNNVTLSIASDKSVNIIVPENVTDLRDAGNYLTKGEMDWYEG